MSPSTGLLAAGIAGKKLVESVVTDLYDVAKSEGGFILKQLKAKRHSEVVYKKIWALRLVKTIWQTEKEVDLSTFYHPSKVFVKGRRVAIHQIADLDYEGNILLEGTVGQGKSILLRYLASTDFCLNQRIPVFIELRRLRGNQPLIFLILQELSSLGFDLTEETFHFFASKGKLILFLDAFDEVRNELREELISDMESLIRRHDQLNVVMTSRPESGAAMSPFLRVFRVCELVNREYEEVIKKMAHDATTANAINQGIRKDAASISQLLTTPLMVALLMIRYKIDQSLPQNSAAFYDSLFSLLLQRHDKSKGGYVRPRKSGVSDIILHDFFNALSFVTRKIGDTSFTESQLIQHARSAAKLINLNEDVGEALKDIIEITCLIIKDGEESKFIHKSVQEYHAALFIKEQPDESAIKFYKAMPANWNRWSQELKFLNQIDKYRYLKYFYISSLKSALEIPTDDDRGNTAKTDSNLTIEKAIRIFGNDNLNFQSNRSKAPHSMNVASCSKHWPLMKYINGSIYIRDIFSIPLNCFEDAIADQGVSATSLTVKEMLESPKCSSRALVACSNYYKHLLEDLRESEIYILQIESMKSAFEF